MVILQLKAIRAYPYPNTSAVAHIDGPAPETAVKHHVLTNIQHVNLKRFVQLKVADHIKLDVTLILKHPRMINSKTCRTARNTTVDGLCIFARKQLSIHILSKA